MQMGDPLRLDMDDWGKLWETIQRSFSINKHVEFFRWLQDEVYWCLPHDVLVAAWGDFSNCRLHYDVASNVPEVHTQQIIDDCGIDPLMCHLYQRWRNGGEQGYILNYSGLIDEISCDKSDACLAKLDQMKSVLVHGIRDRRGNNDCLYVFFDRKTRTLDNQPILELLLPQIDAALRRVECLAPAVTEELAGDAAMGISEREHEIMKWVKLGKTNYEIGVILGISPNTVKSHLRRIFQKLNVFNRAQAVAKYEAPRTLAGGSDAAYEQSENRGDYWALN